VAGCGNASACESEGSSREHRVPLYAAIDGGGGGGRVDGRPRARTLSMCAHAPIGRPHGPAGVELTPPAWRQKNAGKHCEGGAEPSRAVDAGHYARCARVGSQPENDKIARPLSRAHENELW
jgi:hypothetical protein